LARNTSPKVWQNDQLSILRWKSSSMFLQTTTKSWREHQCAHCEEEGRHDLLVEVNDDLDRGENGLDVGVIHAKVVPLAPAPDGLFQRLQISLCAFNLVLSQPPLGIAINYRSLSKRRGRRRTATRPLDRKST
jgi:hypothetical protein